jgi:prevent-host-death family protein
MAVPLTDARSRLGELVDQVRHGHEPVTLTDHGKPVAAIIGTEELTELQGLAAIARHQADKAAGRVTGVTDDELDAALNRYEAGEPWARSASCMRSMRTRVPSTSSTWAWCPDSGPVTGTGS